MKYDYHIIVIGAGSAGLVVASGAAGMGAKVALIEAEKMGGDCLNYGCVPSKSFLKAAHLAQSIKDAEQVGLKASLEPTNLKDIMDYVRSIIQEIEPHDSKERYEGLGVTVIEGKGSLVNKHTVQVDSKTLTGKYIVIATGSQAIVPPIPGLKDTPYLTNKTIFNLDTLPKTLAILGGGPIGLELGQGFNSLGSTVHVIDKLPTLFSKDDPEVGPLMEKTLTKQGLQFHLSSSIKNVKYNDKKFTIKIEKEGQTIEIEADQTLVSLGRGPVSKSLNLDQVGVKTTPQGYIQTNNKLQTSISNIFACGDIVGPYQFTHMAGYQAGIVIRNCVLKLPAKVNYSNVPWTTFTQPEVAHVGYTEPWARKEGLYHSHTLVPLSNLDRAKADHDREGFLKLIIGKKGVLIGATLVGNKAGEIIPIASLAIQKKLKATAFLSIIFSYPTEAEIFKFASLEIVKKSFKPWMKSIIKKII